MTRWRTWLGGTRAVLLQLLALLAAATGYVVDRHPWIGSWKQALDWGAGSTALVGPVAAGCACLAYARLRTSAMHEVLRQGQRDWLRWLQPFLAVWGLACAAVLLLTVTITTMASLAGVPAYPQYVWILIPAFLVLAGQTAIGAAIGWASGRPWAAPAAAVLVFLLYLWTVVGPTPALFVTGGATTSLAGATFRVLPTFGPGVLGIGLAWCVLALANRTTLLATRLRVAVGVAAVVVLGLGWVWTPATSDHYGPVAEPRLTCAGTAPEICVHRETPRPLADLSARAERLARPLLEIGVTLPRRFSATAAPGNGEGRVSMFAEEVAQSSISEGSVLRSLLMPAVCAADSSTDATPIPFEERHLLGRWMEVRAGLVRPDREDGDYAWLTSDLAVQAPWVKRTYHQLTTCDFAAIRMPSGVG